MPGLECRLTFELTPTAEAGRLARVVQHKPVRHAGKTACRSGSGAERGVRRHSANFGQERVARRSDVNVATTTSEAAFSACHLASLEVALSGCPS